jgi:hypothetical protein
MRHSYHIIIFEVWYLHHPSQNLKKLIDRNIKARQRSLFITMKAVRISLMLLSVGAGVLLDGIISSSRYFATLNFNHESLQEFIAPQSNNSTKQESGLQRIAWLMSFPNSGTSYTSYLIRTVTQTNTGSNYGKESGTDPSGLSPSVPIFNDNPIPTWTESWNNHLHQPSKGYILTKTHCGGFSICTACDSFIYNSHTFLKKCLEGDYVTGSAASGVEVSKGYASKDKIARAVHIIRDPFDNVVARFHLERRTLSKKNKAHYPNSVEGFRQFCDDLGKIETAHKQSHVFFEDVLDLDIPCKADFYRYIQWHNMAFTTTWNLAIPTLVVHYESYTTNLNETKDALLEFLEQDEVADAPPFVTGKTYRDYYTADEIDAVSKMTERLALRETWQYMEHYFEQ